MRIAGFARVRLIAFRDLPAGDVFFGGVDGNDLYEKLQGIPNPDPSTGLAVRLGDGFVNGIGLDVLVYTTEGTFVPDGCEPPYVCDPIPEAVTVAAPAPEPPPPPPPVKPVPPPPPPPAAPQRKGPPAPSPAKVPPPGPPAGRRPGRR
jgi:hypothetical protein